jgi:hypothetical protein
MSKKTKITFADDNDLFCAFLGEVGWHSRAISERTNLTESQVNYRLKKAEIKRKSYRDGESKTAELVVRNCAGQIMPKLRRTLGKKFA